MFDTYQQIFNQRGAAYHRAMLTFPRAREEEFRNVLELADIQDGQVVADIPSGGCYLGGFLDRRATIVSIETSAEFVRGLPDAQRHWIVLCQEITQVPLRSASMDRVISLAALHHVGDKLGFYREAWRMLKPGGVLVVADGFAATPVARFLNGWVDGHNSMGHHGEFLDAGAAREIESAGFRVDTAELRRYPWHFPSVAGMQVFCRLLFGADKASDEQVLAGVRDYVGYHAAVGGCDMNWELYFVRAVKVATTPQAEFARNAAKLS